MARFNISHDIVALSIRYIPLSRELIQFKTPVWPVWLFFNQALLAFLISLSYLLAAPLPVRAWTLFSARRL